MKLFGLFGRRADGHPSKEPEQEDGAGGLAAYTGMRVEVANANGQFLFVAKLLGLRGNRAELHLYSEAAAPQEGDPFPVKIRGYSDHERKAVHMEGVLAPPPQKIWPVEALTLIRVDNDRVFFRLSTNLEATATMFSGLEIGEKPCKLLDISVGGARISSDRRYHSGDKFLLKVRLLPDRPESAIFSQVMRIIEKDGAKFEYGCQFLELTEADQEKITQNIFAAQREMRRRT